MAKKMLIDASHREEVRMAIVDGTRLEDFEVENVAKSQIKSNIYLAKVVRIEPSLQAAFVEFGGNRQGFLPFGEIHPDYFQIPVSDRVALQKEAEEASRKQQEEEEALKAETREAAAEEDAEQGTPQEPSSDDAEEDEPRRRIYRHRYKIQEVIKRNQILLVQAVKEERGGKGAALTTYLSLAGRYCVLMPNSGERRGGVSRKISDVKNRKRLRDILNDLDIPTGMSLIVRTAGSEKNKADIKRDFEYLMREWSTIREKTLESVAPSLICAEGDLVKRALRDSYSNTMDEIIVEGDEAYKEARALMKRMMPSHVKKVQQYKEPTVSLFQKYRVESQIDQIFQSKVVLPSGGYLVIGQTEALVAIDVNSGKATRERNIDETAVKTNLEAAKEVARQLRLRDLAGLIVIDFIDMNEKSHINQVERVFRESLSMDRARIQTSRISQFGLLEMSRQRLRPSVLESNTAPCPHCLGSGTVRSVDSMALFVLRQIEASAIANPNTVLSTTVPEGVDVYLLNEKRRDLVEIETQYNTTILIRADRKLKNTEYLIDIKADQDTSKALLALIEEETEDKKPEQKRPQASKKDKVTKGNRPEKQSKSVEKTVEDESMEASTASSEAPQEEKRPSRSAQRRNRRRNRHKNQTATEQGASPSSPDGESPAKTSTSETDSNESSTSTEQSPSGNKERHGRNHRRRSPFGNRRRPENQRNDNRHGGTEQTSPSQALQEIKPEKRESKEKKKDTQKTSDKDESPKHKSSKHKKEDIKTGGAANTQDDGQPKKRGWWKRLIES